MKPLKIKVIIGSTRPGRFSEKPAGWIAGELKKMESVEVELLDLRDYPMPFYEQTEAPSHGKGVYENKVVAAWAAKIKDGDAFIVVTPEYNHGYPAVLKNALDSIYPEWIRKAVGFVSWGSVGGGRVVEQLRTVAIELQLVPIRRAIHIPSAVTKAVKAADGVDPALFGPLREPKDMVGQFLDQLLWMTRALKTARETKSSNLLGLRIWKSRRSL